MSSQQLTYLGALRQNVTAATHRANETADFETKRYWLGRADAYRSAIKLAEHFGIQDR